ncbi:hypothetical protein QJQ45_014826 [Haematococcus lacustris]|nr:hypothetical protein QJQ45_014826 [Haematococcus lacustris]
MGLYSKSHPYRRKGGHAARCACCATCTPAGSTGWVEIHVEGEAASYRSGQSLLAIGQVTAQMAEVMKVCDNLEPALIPLAHRTCAEAAAAALAVGKRLQGQELASQLQPMPSLCSTPTQAAAQPGPAHAPCPHHLPDHHPSQSQLQGLLHIPGLSILTRPATNRPHLPRSSSPSYLQQIQQVPALLRLLRLQPDSKVTLQLSTLQDAEAQLGRLEFALQHIMQPSGKCVYARPVAAFAPDSVMQLCTLGKKLSVKMLNEYCKAVGLYVPVGKSRADLRYIVLQHLNEQAECD